MHQLEPLCPIQGLSQHTQTVEVVEQVVLDMLQPGLYLAHTVPVDAKGEEFGLGQTIVALGQLLAQHLAVLGPDIVKAVPLKGDADAPLKAFGVGGQIHEGQLKADAAVKEIQKAAPFLKDSGLVLLLGQLIVDVLELDGAGVVPGADPAGAVLKHPLERDGLLRRAGDSRFYFFPACRRRRRFDVLIALFPKQDQGPRLLS